jgi:hypothetical protein
MILGVRNLRYMYGGGTYANVIVNILAETGQSAFGPEANNLGRDAPVTGIRKQ